MVTRLRVEAEKTQGEMRLNQMPEIDKLRAYQKRASNLRELSWAKP